MSAGDLASLQRFVTDVVRGKTPLTDRADLAASIDALARPSTRGMTPRDRLEVYREQYWLRHVASLEEDFPTLMAVVGGRDALRELLSAYLEAYPPRTWDLQRLGADVRSYVRDVSPWRAHALAQDAVRLDWAFMEAFDAADAAPFDPRVIATAPEDAWPGARLELHPSVRLLALGHPVHVLRTAVQRGEAIVLPDPSDTPVVVHRDAACFLQAVPIEAPALSLLESLQRGTPLGEATEACARANAREPLEIGERLGQWFQDWTARGWVTAVRFAG